VLLLSKAFSNDNLQNKDNWVIQKSSPFLSYSAEFSYLKGEIKDSVVIRTGLLCPRYFYELYDLENNFQARGITRFFSLGFLSPEFIDIDVYDDNQNCIGLIQGKIFTKSRAKFVFYDYKQEEIAVACLEAETFDFLIVSAKDGTKILAKLTGNTFGEVGIINMELVSKNMNLDERLLKIFGAYVSDWHEEFLEKPKEIHHHHYDYPQDF